MATKKALLSIDGGGIRGIIPLCALVELERQTSLQARQIFSFIGGTSTGAIITAGLALGIKAEQLLEVYRNLGPKVFVTDWLLFVRSIGSYKYAVEPLRKFIASYTGEVTLNELPIEVMITATRVSDGHPWFFVRDNNANGQSTGHLKLADVVTASAAAPTFFEPFYVPTIGVCVDGGVGVAGNPLYQSCVEAFYYSDTHYDPATTTVISLGTGFVDGGSSAPGNLIDWVRWIVGELLDAPSQQQTQITERHFKTSATVRINPRLDYPIEMDDVTSIGELERMGRAYAQQLDWKKILTM